MKVMFDNEAPKKQTTAIILDKNEVELLVQIINASLNPIKTLSSRSKAAKMALELEGELPY